MCILKTIDCIVIYNELSQKTRFLITKGLITKDLITKALTTKGLITKDLKTKGLLHIRPFGYYAF